MGFNRLFSIFRNQHKMKLTKKLFLPILLASLVFTFSDFLVHYFVEFFKITDYPTYYSFNELQSYSLIKFLATIPLVYLGIFLSSRFKEYKLNIITLLVVIPLQFRYMTYDYSTSFLIGLFILHYTLFYLSTYLVFKYFKIKL